jgi:voltage-gated potassium channel Kch
MGRPIIVCGLGRTGARALEYLLAAGMPVVVIDGACKPDDPRLGRARLLQGDCRRRELLAAAGLAQARGVPVLAADDLLNISTALMVRGIDGGVPVVLRMFNQNLIGRLGKSVRNVFALSTSLLTAPILALAAITGQALGSRLEAGDRVLCLVALSDLDRPLQREPPSAALAVDVSGCPRPAGEWLAGLVRVRLGCAADEAAEALEALPLRLGTSLTRGQAEDLLAQLQRERVAACVRLAVAVAHEPADVEAVRPPHRRLPRQEGERRGRRPLRPAEPRRLCLQPVQRRFPRGEMA